jgi:hypothetical protein
MVEETGVPRIVYVIQLSDRVYKMNNKRFPSTISFFSPSSIWKAPFIGGLF